MLDEARTIPRLAIGVAAARLGDVAAALPRLVAAGVDGAIVAAPDGAEFGARPDSLERVRAAFGGEAVLLQGSLARARAARVGVLLPERGMATAEARRLLGPGLPVARLVGSAPAATAARGADLIVVERAVAGDLAHVRRIVAASWEPALAWCAPVSDAARAAVAAGCEGVVVDWAALEPGRADDALAALAAVLPPSPTRGGEATPITLDGVAMTVEPDTTIADLLADANRPDDVVVRVNGVRLARHRHDDTVVRPGDAIETGAPDSRRR
jgi:thiamine biosynthesis protein ThiS